MSLVPTDRKRLRSGYVKRRRASPGLNPGKKGRPARDGGPRRSRSGGRVGQKQGERPRVRPPWL